MTRKEALRLLKLERENQELRDQLERQMQIYREQIWELVQYRAEREMLVEILSAPASSRA